MECTSYREALLEVLYDEAPPERRRRLQEHTEVCDDCRAELLAFRQVRAELRADVLPALRPGRALQGTPWFTRLAAAAVFLAFATGLVRMVQLERRLASQHALHAQEMAALAALAQARATIQPSALELEQVASLLRASEERQDQRLEASLRELAARHEAQRRYDLARVSAGLSYLEGRTGQHMARTTELMGHVLQASERR